MLSCALLRAACAIPNYRGRRRHAPASGLSLLSFTTNADWRGVRYGAVAGTAVGGVSYFHAIVAAALSGMSY